MRLFESKGAVLLRADLSTDNPPAELLLEELGNVGHSLPFLAVFCGDKPDEPRVLEDFNWLNPGPYKSQLRKILAECPDPNKLETALKP
jgi:hypothetical protein